MNGARSTFMRKGYLLTALAAAVLLAASSGTAYAQSIGFSGSSNSIMEGASPDKDTPAPIVIEINISGLTLEGDNANRETGLGNIQILHDADTAYSGQATREDDDRRIWVDGESSALDEARITAGADITPDDEHGVANGKYAVDHEDDIPYDNNGVIRLVIIDPDGDGNWVDNKFSINIESDALGISPNPGSYRVTVIDTDVQPAVTFSKTNVSLTEETQTTVPVAITVGVPSGTKADVTPAGIASLSNNIRFTTSPKGAAVLDNCVADSDDDVIAITLAGIDGAEDDGTAVPETYQVTGGAGSVGTATISIEACGDMSGFNDEMVTFSFTEKSLTGAPAGYGNLSAGPDLVVTVRSEGEAKPTVSFATTSIAIDEGDTNTVAILADGTLGAEVGTVMVSMGGDAMISLWQGNDMLEAGATGMFEVMLGTADKPSANTILTISADSDAALEDGMTSSATLTIESANGATIGDRDSVTVTVSGSTAVAALPLLAQLLLALFLMAGGARLYRRRNG